MYTYHRDPCQKLYQAEPHLKMLISIIIGKHMKMLCFKFHQNCTINEEFYFGGEGQNSFGGPEGGRGHDYKKFEKASYRTVVPTKDYFYIDGLRTDFNGVQV